jgi:hypothetical protein
VEELARKVRIPISRSRRTQPTWAKLLKRIDPRSRSPFEWRGRFFRPGAWVEENALWPDGTFPRTPLLVEHAGAEAPARGHNRHRCDNTVILWRYDRATGQFAEVGRVAAPAGLWMHLLEPLVRECFAREMGMAPAADLDLIRSRITQFLQAELRLITDAERGRVLTLVHDELAARFSEWGDGGGAFAHFGSAIREM